MRIQVAVLLQIAGKNRLHALNAVNMHDAI